MTDDTKTPEPKFPQYQPPVKNGVPHADPKQSGPLYKMMRMMMKPRTKRNVVTRSPKRGKKSRIKFH